MTKTSFCGARRPLFLILTTFILLICSTTTPLHAQDRDLSDGPLTWDDFKGDKPDGSNFNAYFSGSVKLETPTERANSSGARRGVPPNGCIICKDCKPRQRGKKQFSLKNTKKCKVKVKAVMHQGSSWKDSDQSKLTKELLAHEQGHADLTSAAAKAAEKEINSMKKCLSATNCSDKNIFRDAINQVINDANTKLQEQHDKYDEETDHGRNKEKQKEWEKKIKDLLAVKGGPSWEDFNTLAATGSTGGNRIVVDPRNHLIVPIDVPSLVFQNSPLSSGPVTLVLPPLTFEDHDGENSRIWAYDAKPVIGIYDESQNLIGQASFTAFYGDGTDQTFTAVLYGLTEPEPFEEVLVPGEPDSGENDTIELTDVIVPRLTLTVDMPLGVLLTDLGPYQTFSITATIGESGPPEPGDMNYDGVVNDMDVEALSQYLSDGTGPILTEYTGDLNYDGSIDSTDLEILIATVQGDVVSDTEKIE